MPLPPTKVDDCPFCRIAEAYPASTEFPAGRVGASGAPLAYVLVSTPQLIAFLDHAPISRGHVLIATRQHRTKISDISVEEGQAIGSWLGIISRAVVQSVLSSEGNEEYGDWNIVQNNGARAAQVVPHVHFHIIPRPGDVPEVRARSWTIFGKGQREDLDDEDAETLIVKMRERLRLEIEKLEQREGEAVVKTLTGGLLFGDKPKL